ncbi:hypothetical protein PSN45_001483 [Yamadazyma tenuis]|uniref:uncharacterized protein n=1 Tax=Candida tenuis TaxID=2315449 RepID=UPI00279CD31D|nr:hypothetical protein PSN45_001483 [Yamadazyma tenuis]
MNIHLADSLEEFDISYIESYNQCVSSVYSDDADALRSRSNSISSKTSQLTLSSPLMNNPDDYSTAKSDAKISIFSDRKLKLTSKDVQDSERTYNVKDFKRPPLKPSATLDSIPCKKTLRRNMGNPFYRPPPPIRANSTGFPPLRQK